MVEILHVRVQGIWLIICVKSFLLRYTPLAKVHPLQTDKRTDGQMTEDNHVNSSTVT